MKRFLFMGLIVLTGCMGEDKEDADMKGSKSCDPAAFEFLIGQPKEALEGVMTPETVRILAENAPATMDHRPDRLNVIHDADGNILKVTCG